MRGDQGLILAQMEGGGLEKPWLGYVNPQLTGKDCTCLRHISKGAHIHHNAEEH